MMSGATRSIAGIVGGSVTSVLGFFAVGLGHDLLRSARLAPPWGGDKGNVLWGLFLGVPIGAATGLWLVERAGYRSRPPILKALAVGAIPAWASAFVAVLMADRMGVAALLFLPLAAAVCLTAALRVVSRSAYRR